jgi:hypothetical protein
MSIITLIGIEIAFLGMEIKLTKYPVYVSHILKPIILILGYVRSQHFLYDTSFKNLYYRAF